MSGLDYCVPVHYYEFLDRNGKRLSFSRMILDGEEYQWLIGIPPRAPRKPYLMVAFRAMERTINENAA